MGNDAIVTRANSTVTTQDWYNLIQRIISGDLYPRDGSSGAATNEAAALGSATYRWKKLNALSGEHTVGTIKVRHSYNGLVVAGHGWMLCDGRQVNKANYDTEHGAGSWDSKIIASSLEDKYLPNLTGRYLSGAASVAQSGDSAITSIGSPGNLGMDHGHNWYSGGNAYGYDEGGFSIALNTGAGNKTGGALTLEQKTGAAHPLPPVYTAHWSIDVKPESIEMLHYMRIV